MATTATRRKEYKRHDHEPTVVTIKLHGFNRTYDSSATMNFSIDPPPLIPITAECILSLNRMNRWRLDEVRVTGLPYPLREREKYALRNCLRHELPRLGYKITGVAHYNWGFPIDRITEVFE